MEAVALAYIGEAFLEQELVLDGNAEGRLFYFGLQFSPVGCETCFAPQRGEKTRLL